MGIGNGALRLRIPGLPLLRTRRALGELPVVLVQVLQEPVVPLGRLVRPGALQPAGERVGALAAPEGVPPTEALLLDGCTFGFGTAVFLTDGAVGLAERVAADNERQRLLVVHGHPAEGLSNVLRRSERVRVSARPLRIHVDQAHVIGAQGSVDLAFPTVAFVAEPGVLGAPEDLVGLPDVLAPEPEAERLEPHRLVGTVAGENDEVGPGDLPAVLLLDRPQQPARLVKVRVVRPTVQGGEALRALAATAPAVGDAVRAGGMPRHPDEERPIVAVVGRPPFLRRGHHLEDVLLERFDVQGGELILVVEVLTHRIGQGRVLAQNGEIHLIRPPVPIRQWPMLLGSRRGDCWALALAFAAAVRHVGSPVSVVACSHRLLVSTWWPDAHRPWHSERRRRAAEPGSYAPAAARVLLPRQRGRQPGRQRWPPRPSDRSGRRHPILSSDVVCGCWSRRLDVHSGHAGASPRRPTCGGTPPLWLPAALPIDHWPPPPTAWLHVRAPGRPERRSPRTTRRGGHLVGAPASSSSLMALGALSWQRSGGTCPVGLHSCSGSWFSNSGHLKSVSRTIQELFWIDSSRGCRPVYTLRMTSTPLGRPPSCGRTGA